MVPDNSNYTYLDIITEMARTPQRWWMFD